MTDSNLSRDDNQTLSTNTEATQSQEESHSTLNAVDKQSSPLLPTIDIALKAIVPPTTLGVLGRIFGALSIFALLQHSFSFGLSATFEVVLDVYNVALKATIGLLDPVVESLIDWLHRIFGFTLIFSEGWRHIFLILQILFARDAGTAFSDGRRMLGLVRLLCGVVVAFSTAVFAFISELDSVFISNAILCVIPIFGLLIYDLVMYAVTAIWFFDSVGTGEVTEPIGRREFFIVGVQRSIVRFSLVTAGSLIIFLTPWARKLDFPDGGLLAMTIGLVANAIYWVSLGTQYATEQKRSGRRFKDAFLESEAGRFGLAVIGLLFWFAFFSSLNAGMRLLGF